MPSEGVAARMSVSEKGRAFVDAVIASLAAVDGFCGSMGEGSDIAWYMAGD